MDNSPSPHEATKDHLRDTDNDVGCDENSCRVWGGPNSVIPLYG